MKGLEFLKKASLVSNEIVKPAVARTVTAKNRNPENADIRIYKDGSVYPSAALVAEFDLAYRRKEETGGQAFDVFKSADFPNTQSWTEEERVLFIAALDRNEAKTDLFSGSKFDEAGLPTADVFTQGSNTFGKGLLENIKEVYGEEPGEVGYIDLVILRDYPFTNPDGIYYIPKVVSRGDKKGESTIVRRENLTLYPLAPASVLSEPAGEEPSTENGGLGEGPAPVVKTSKVTAEATA